MKSILDPSFRYVPSGETDLRKTYSRIRREMQRASPNGPQADTPLSSRILILGRPKGLETPS